MPLNIVDGVRTGPGVGFLKPALRRPNLKVLSRTHARRVAIANGRAIGVDAAGPDGHLALTADRIVLCAGAIGSAHLLMLSGIGDEAMLRRAGAPVLLPSPVGRHSADHAEWVMATDWRTATKRPVLEVVLSTGDGIEIRPHTGGFVTMMGDRAGGHPDWPHIGVALMRPKARGRVTLESADPDVAPHVEQRYDSDPDDVAALRAAAELARDICHRSTRIGPPIWSTSQHLCGTAPMGVAGDEHAVLDEQCRVRGIDGLWVVDGSVLPAITSRGPHATIVMIAYRAAEPVRGASRGASALVRRVCGLFALALVLHAQATHSV